MPEPWYDVSIGSNHSTKKQHNVLAGYLTVKRLIIRHDFQGSLAASTLSTSTLFSSSPSDTAVSAIEYVTSTVDRLKAWSYLTKRATERWTGRVGPKFCRRASARVRRALCKRRLWHKAQYMGLRSAREATVTSEKNATAGGQAAKRSECALASDKLVIGGGVGGDACGVGEHFGGDDHACGGTAGGRLDRLGRRRSRNGCRRSKPPRVVVRLRFLSAVEFGAEIGGLLSWHTDR